MARTYRAHVDPDTAAELQVAYDKAVLSHGDDSPEAQAAERVMRDYLAAPARRSWSSVRPSDNRSEHRSAS